MSDAPKPSSQAYENEFVGCLGLIATIIVTGAAAMGVGYGLYYILPPGTYPVKLLAIPAVVVAVPIGWVTFKVIDHFIPKKPLE